MSDKENGKEVLLVKSLSHKRANELRSILTKNINHIWVLVFHTKVEHEFDVYIANEWGGKPSQNQLTEAQTFSNSFSVNSEEPETLRDNDFIDVTDEVQFTL